MDVMANMDGQACTLNPTPLPAMPVVAMAYVPFQQFSSTYTPEKGLEMGTIFPDLDKPFLGGGSK
ncbi:spore coat associated protein CotJA [Caproiciproducens sp. LBM24188]